MHADGPLALSGVSRLVLTVRRNPRLISSPETHWSSVGAMSPRRAVGGIGAAPAGRRRPGGGRGPPTGARRICCARTLPSRGVCFAREESGSARWGVEGRKARAEGGTARVAGGGATVSSAIAQQQVGPCREDIRGEGGQGKGPHLRRGERKSVVREEGGEGGGVQGPALSCN